MPNETTYDILYESCPWHTRVALFNQRGKLIALRFDDSSRKYLEGTIILGRVRKISKPLEVAFVDIGDAVDGFLPLNKLDPDSPPPTEGSKILVRVARSRREDKGALLDGRTAVEAPKETVKIPHIVFPAPNALRRILMDAGDHPVRVWIQDERAMEEVNASVNKKHIFRLDQQDELDLTSHLDEKLDHMSGNTHSLPSGGSIIMERTKAITAFDVDSGSTTGKNREDVALKTNLEAVEEITRLCALLDIGGSIVIDFITCKKKLMQEVRAAQEESFANHDMSSVQVLEMSRFGLLELNRKRHGESIDVLVQNPDYVAGRILLELFRDRTSTKTTKIEASTHVADILKNRLTTAASLAYLGRQVEIKENQTYPDPTYKII